MACGCILRSRLRRVTSFPITVGGMSGAFRAKLRFLSPSVVVRDRGGGCEMGSRARSTSRRAGARRQIPGTIAAADA
jgi:hypothetical protein